MNDSHTPANDSVSLREVLRVPWGEGGLPDTWIEVYPSSRAADTPRLMRASVRVRALPAGDISVLAGEPTLAPAEAVAVRLYSAQGALLGAVPLAAPGGARAGWRIKDFLADGGGDVYLLETFDGDAGLLNSLRKLNARGEVVWARTGPFAATALDLARLQGDFEQLLTDGRGNVYLAATRHRGEVVRLNPADGTPEPYADWGEWTGGVFMDGEGRLYYVRYDPALRRRGWACYDPRTRSEEIHEGDASVYGLFDLPFGTDARGRCYAAMGGRLACLTREAALLWLQQLDNVVVDGDALYASESRGAGESAEISLRRWTREGDYAGETILNVPAHLAPEGGAAAWRLVSLDDAGRFHVRSFATAARAEAELVYSPRGELEAVTQPAPPAPAPECRLQPGRTWSVDLRGRVHLPVLGPRGLHVVALTVGAAGG